VQCWPPDRQRTQRPARLPAALLMTTTDDSEQNSTGSLGGPVTKSSSSSYQSNNAYWFPSLKQCYANIYLARQIWQLYRYNNFFHRQASKILLRIILEKIRVKTKTEIADDQAGFRQGRWIRNQITNLRKLMHKAREHQQPLYMCFVDFKKAFDSDSRDKLWMSMMDMGYPLHLINLLAKLYRKQLTKVKVAETLSDWFHVQTGVQ